MPVLRNLEHGFQVVAFGGVRSGDGGAVAERLLGTRFKIAFRILRRSGNDKASVTRCGGCGLSGERVGGVCANMNMKEKLCEKIVSFKIISKINYL